jgi:hypothetical protein
MAQRRCLVTPPPPRTRCLRRSCVYRNVLQVGNQVTTGSPSASRTYFNLADPIASLVFGVITLFTTVKYPLFPVTCFRFL